MTICPKEQRNCPCSQAIGTLSAEFRDPAVERDFRLSVDQEQRRLTIAGGAVMAAAMLVLSVIDMATLPHGPAYWLCIAVGFAATAAIGCVAWAAVYWPASSRPFAAVLGSCAGLLLAGNVALLAVMPPGADALAVLLTGQMMFAALVLSARPKLAVGFILACVALYGASLPFLAGQAGALARNAVLIAAAAYIAVELTRRPALSRRALYCANANWRASNEEMARVLSDLEGERDAVQSAAARNIELVEEMDFMRQDAERQSAFLRVVFDNITQGVAVFGRDQGLKTWNQRFEILLGLPPAMAREGVPLEEIIRHRLQLAQSENAQQILDDAMQATREIQDGTREHLCWEGAGADGRILAIRATANPGGGVLVTYADITDSKAAENAARHQAQHDALTGLKNRRGFMEILSRAAAPPDASVRFALALFDLDGFKAVNDTHGHPFGDALLKKVGDIITAEVREGDCVARLGGDEFAVVFQSIRDVAEAEAAAQRILARLHDPVEIEGRKLHVGTSIGLGFFPQDGESLDELFSRVDQALYRAKHQGKGRVVKVAA